MRPLDLTAWVGQRVTPGAIMGLHTMRPECRRMLQTCCTCAAVPRSPSKPHLLCHVSRRTSPSTFLLRSGGHPPHKKATTHRLPSLAHSPLQPHEGAQVHDKFLNALRALGCPSLFSPNAPSSQIICGSYSVVRKTGSLVVGNPQQAAALVHLTLDALDVEDVCCAG